MTPTGEDSFWGLEISHFRIWIQVPVSRNSAIRFQNQKCPAQIREITAECIDRNELSMQLNSLFNDHCRAEHMRTPYTRLHGGSLGEIKFGGNWSGSNINSYGIRGGFTGSFNPQYKRWQNLKMGQKG